jgi:NADPH:quinone reductase-like Zn-dependent oxidoreductase
MRYLGQDHSAAAYNLLMPTQIRFHRTGGPDVLQYDEVPSRKLETGEVRLKVEAIGLNRAEVMFREGQYTEAPILPSSLGYEAAGVIQEVGPGVDGLKPGDRVATIPAFSMKRYGTYGDSVVLPAAAIAVTPDKLSSVEAAACWMQYLTAYMLVEFGDMKAGDDILITAAASSVGLAAIQIANACGARPIATTRNQNKVAALLDAGAKFVINTKESKLVDEVKRLTGGKGANIIFDPVVGPQLAELCEAAAQDANIFAYGALSPEPSPLPLLTGILKCLTFRTYALMIITTHPDRLASAKRWVLDGLSHGRLKPVIAKIFPFGQMAEAHHFMESNEQIGKIVVTVP